MYVKGIQRVRYRFKMVYGFKKALKITNWLLVHPLFELRCMYLTKKGIETAHWLPTE